MKNTEESGEKYFKPSRFTPPDNAGGIKQNAISGINRLVKLSVVINGKIIKSYKHFKLTQSATKHHEFELTLAHDALDKRQNHQLEDANVFLGQRLTVKILYKDIEESPESVFVGVITGVSFSQDSHSLGNIVLKGFSPTILLDSAPHTQSFGGTQAVNMGIIANEVIKQGISNYFDIRVESNSDSEILYSAQYNETHYNYLCRMAEAYGEQFYYDGEVLHFGSIPPKNKPIELIYGSNIFDVNVELKAVHINPGFYGYNSSSNAKLTSGETFIDHKSDLAKTSYTTNKNIFKTRSLQVAPIRAATDRDVVNSQKSSAGSRASDVFSVSGNTTVPFLYPGCVADINMRRMDSNETSYFTRLMMTEVTHDIDTLGHYKGTFKAIASDTGYLPTPEFTLPIAQPQLAKVISNTDPQGQGRVTVRFDWQLHDTTDFIRMMSPDAGGTDKVSQNRGYVAIPEVGDQVMVGFVHNHPDRPFVMGGMFHGKIGLGGGAQNHMRSIQTKSGIKVLMNDNEKSVTILDPSGNTYFMDGAGNIKVTAPKNMTFNAGENLAINVGQNMTTSVGANQSDTIGMNKSTSVTMNNSQSVGMLNMLSVGTDFITNVMGKMTEFITGNKESHTEKDRTRIANGKISTQSGDVYEQHSKKEVKNNSGEISKNH